jgi:ribulose-phosphate 3-epimerase
VINSKRRVLIAPSMIASDWARPLETVRELEAAQVEWLHWDAMDGHFVPNLTLGPMFLAALRPHTKLHFDAHLMLSNAGDYVDEFIKAGANSISVHVEANTHLHRVIARIKEGGALAGAVLNPATPPNTLDTILPELDYVLVMSVNPGFSGQKFLPRSVEKVAALDEMRRVRGLDFLIQVDGGMAPTTAPAMVRAGADVLVCGSNIFSDGTPAQNVAALREAIREATSGARSVTV